MKFTIPVNTRDLAPGRYICKHARNTTRIFRGRRVDDSSEAWQLLERLHHSLCRCIRLRQRNAFDDILIVIKP